MITVDEAIEKLMIISANGCGDNELFMRDDDDYPVTKIIKDKYKDKGKKKIIIK